MKPTQIIGGEEEEEGGGRAGLDSRTDSLVDTSSGGAEQLRVLRVLISEY